MANALAAQPPVNHDEMCLAPLFVAGVDKAILACHAAGLDAMIHETCRAEALQEWYFTHGASKARTVMRSWHGYGLAVDIVSRERGWDVWPTWDKDGRIIAGSGDPAWYVPVVQYFKAYGMKWGGDWVHFHDTPHFQWGRCKPSPSDEAVRLMASGGVHAVWVAVGAA